MLLPSDYRSIKTKCSECGKELNISMQDGELTNGAYTEEGKPLCFSCYREYMGGERQWASLKF